MRHKVKVEVEIETDGEKCGIDCQFMSELANDCNWFDVELNYTDDPDNFDLARCPECRKLAEE